MADLRLRAIVGAILIALALIADWFGGWLFAIAVATGAGLIFAEWRAMTRGWGAGWFVGGVAYALVPAVALLWTRLLPEGASLVLWAFVVTWATDIFAYLVGRAFGGPKLAPTMSPNKTWSGLAGGVAGATLLGGLLAVYLDLPTEFLLAAPFFAVAAQIGDLLESGLKRRAGVKDAGKMLPGHGGVMDRLDGLVPVAVMTAMLATVAT
ncbi:MAG TPA: phosphatidate cytidylyltransferase [Sphingomonadaceae bacterium]|nr:phosphatidate cytidylyltransferase [Sphingomonadaceae bacterium]